MGFPISTVLNFVGTLYTCLYIFSMSIKFIHSYNISLAPLPIFLDLPLLVLFIRLQCYYYNCVINVIVLLL